MTELRSIPYFCDVIGEVPLEVKVDMRNIGIVPFYYDHTTWPVMIGLKYTELVAESTHCISK